MQAEQLSPNGGQIERRLGWDVYNVPVPAGAVTARLCAAGADIRFTTDGSAPTADHGERLTVGIAQHIDLDNERLIRFLRTRAGAMLSVCFENAHSDNENTAHSTD